MQRTKNCIPLVVVAAAGLAVSAHAAIVPISQSYQMAGEAHVASKAMSNEDTQGFDDANALSIEKATSDASVLKNGHGRAAMLSTKGSNLYSWTDANAYTSAALDNLLVQSTAGGTFEGLSAKGDRARFASKSSASIEFQVTSPIAIELSGWIDGVSSMGGKEGPFGFARWASLSLSSEKGLIHAMSTDDKGFEGATKFSDTTKLDVGTYRLDVASYVEGDEMTAWEHADAFSGASLGITVVPTPATAALALIGVATMARRRRA